MRMATRSASTGRRSPHTTCRSASASEREPSRPCRSPRRRTCPWPRRAPRAEAGATRWHERRLRLAAAGRGGRALHRDADLHGDRQVRRALAALVLAAAAASIPGAAAGRGIGLSASPLRLTFRGASTAAVTVRNPGRRTLRVDISRAGFARSLRGRPPGPAGSRRREVAPDAPEADPDRSWREGGPPRPRRSSRVRRLATTRRSCS